MIYDIAEQDNVLKEQAVSMARNRFQQIYGDGLRNASGVYEGTTNSLGTGYTYDDNGDVIEPEGGDWSLDMPIGSAPLRA